MKWIFQRFFSPTKLCDIARIQCAAWTGFGVRHTPDSLCGMLRIMHLVRFSITALVLALFPDYLEIRYIIHISS
jgi:hypothetical protein